MGRISDAVLALLADGPADVEQLGEALARGGVTRARDPAAAVRRATRDDPRVVQTADGRLASLEQALAGVELTTEVSPEAQRCGLIDVEPDLAPLEMLGIGPTLPLPRGARVGELVCVRVEDPLARVLSLRVLTQAAPRPSDEAALLDAIHERLSRWRPDRPWVAPPVTHLATIAVSLAADAPSVMRAPGRPLSRVLLDAGYEVHLGWVGQAGTEWSSLTEEEVHALEAEVSELLAAERPDEAALAQERLLGVLRRHLPERVPAGRRRLARALARAGRSEEALATLTEAFGEDDPEDCYEACLIAYRTGDEVSARRWAESGLARAGRDDRAEAAACLADIAGDLDAQAAFLRLRGRLESSEPGPEAAERIAADLGGLGRSYLVEAMAEEIVRDLAPDEVLALASLLVDEGEEGREACLALAAVLPPALSRRVREAAGRFVRPRSPAIAGLLEARPAAAWITSPDDAPDQRQVVITVAKEQERVSPLVALIDLDDLGGGIKDAFFLPDLIEPRLARELFAPMHELGLSSRSVELEAAVAMLRSALERTREIGWRIPSLEQQPVIDRIDRWLLRRHGLPT